VVGQHPRQLQDKRQSVAVYLLGLAGFRIKLTMLKERMRTEAPSIAAKRPALVETFIRSMIASELAGARR